MKIVVESDPEPSYSLGPGPTACEASGKVVIAINALLLMGKKKSSGLVINIHTYIYNI